MLQQQRHSCISVSVREKQEKVYEAGERMVHTTSGIREDSENQTGDSRPNTELKTGDSGAFDVAFYFIDEDQS